MTAAAILIAPHDAAPLRALADRLHSVGVSVTVVDELATAVERAGRHATPPALLLDLRDLGDEAGISDVDDLRAAGEIIGHALTALPDALPIAITSNADATLVSACIRAGAGDVIDLMREGTATARAVVGRICERQAERAAERAAAADQRSIIEELLRDLIRTERRSIDAEEALAAHARTTGEIPGRAPAVLLVEHERAVADELADRLESAGVATFAYVSGEEALREADKLVQTTGLDLALIAAQLPGIDGLETVRLLREKVSGLPALLMTSVHDVELAERAADLGVVGFVQKPLAAIDEFVARLTQLAHDSLHRTREARYLQRIKERHERVLARYRSLPRAT